MAARIPPVWCADLLVALDPCAAPGAVNPAEPADFPLRNDLWDAQAGTVRLAGAAGEVLAFQLVLEKRAGALEALRLEGADGCGLALLQQVAVPVDGRFHDDPLVPVAPARAAEVVPEITRQAPRLKGRRRQAFTVELTIPRGAPAGAREAALVLKAGGRDLRLKLALAVHGFELPEAPGCTADLNCYGRVPGPGSEGIVEDSESYRAVEREHFRMAREHLALFHLLPYTHAGRIEDGYAPVLSGRGRNRHVADWMPFDRHWGPYLDGSAFRGCRGGERPVEYLYLPVNLNWPAYFENFGTPGYQVEFGNVLGEMARHFAERGWTRTKFEVFFNHKARWKYFPWDMDEIRFDRDNQATALLARMAIEATKDVPAVKFVNRIDSSWIFDQSARTELGDLINLWVVNRTSHSAAPDEVALLRQKGQAVWPYGGAGAVAGPVRLDCLRWPWLAWGRETDGFTWWHALGWGRWEAVGRGGDHCLYPGARFGIAGPLASLRLKVLRRGMQDHAYLSLLVAKTGSRRAADEIVGRTVGANSREDWYQRGEGIESGGAEIQTASRTEKPWNTAGRSAWAAARAEVARAIEKA